MTLKNKRIVIFAAYGAVASEVARQAAAAGAEVLLTGLRAAPLEALRKQIEREGGDVRVEVVDATDATEVRTFLAKTDAAGGIDALFNGIGLRAIETGCGTPAPELSMRHFLRPLEVQVGSTFLTAALAGPYMTSRNRGSIVTLSTSLSGAAVPFMAGISAACGGIEALTRSLAGEFGRGGVRVNCVRATAMSDTMTIRDANSLVASAMGAAPPENPIAENLLHRHITVADTAGAVLYLMSDGSAGMTGQIVNVCGGTLLN